MKKIVLNCICIMTLSFADISTVQRPLSPIVRPIIPIDRPVVRPIIVREDHNYYTNVVSSCDTYIKTIKEKDQEIETLKKEIESLKNKEQAIFQKSLKTEYEQELKKFDKRKSGLNTKNSIDISDK